MVHARDARRLVEKCGVREAGCLCDQVDRARTLAGGIVEAPAGIGPVEMDGAGSVLARGPARKIGAAQRTPVAGKLCLREQSRQPVVGRDGQPVTHRRQVMAGGGGGDIVQVDHRVPFRPVAPGRARPG